MRHASVAAALLVVAGVASTARADQDTEAKEHFNRGVKFYNLGRFQEAIPEFEKAYELDPVPILLFNIAQSQRQNGNKDRALFFYRRYLEQEPNSSKRADVEQRMKDLEQELRQENEQKQKPPTEVSPPQSTPPPATPPPAAPAPAPAPQPPEAAPFVVPIRLAVALGPTFVSLAGANDIPGLTLFGVQVNASYDFLDGPSELHAGVEGEYAAFPYTDRNTQDRRSSSLWGAMVTVDYAYRPIERLSVGAGVGGGVVWWAGLAAGNPFTYTGIAASGAIPMPSFAISLHADYRLSPRLFVTLNPAFVYSETTSDGLTAGTSSIRRFRLDAGAGYRF